MNIGCIGINHRTAPVEIREKFWFSAVESARALSELFAKKLVREAVLVSTCNRTELYYIPGDVNGSPLWTILARNKNGSDFEEKHFYNFTSAHAVRHIFSVASGIDSMVLGEDQILSQMKEAYASAREQRFTGAIMSRLFDAAFHTGKRARTETEIGEGAVSVSYAAAELATKIFEDFSRRTALLIGAGETGKLTARHLAGRGLGTLLIANRTRERAAELAADLGAEVVDMDRMMGEIHRVDILISSVESPAYILSAEDLRRAMRSREKRPLFIIDIGVPRNIDPSANSIENVFLKDIDVLNHAVDRNLRHRRDEIPKVEQIILDELTRFTHWYDSLDVTPTIQQLREHFEFIRTEEVEKHLSRFSPESRAEIETMTKRIVNKILHAQMVNLKSGSTETRAKVSIIRYIFGLDKEAGS